MTSPMIRRLKTLKHRLFLAKKAVRRAPDRLATRISTARPYAFNPNAYRQAPSGMNFHRHTSSTFKVNHLLYEPMASKPPTDAIPAVMYCFWTGTNALTPPRRAALAALRSVNADVDVRLVTPETLPDFILDSHPLHATYERLSYVHRSDYLRAYFMHHHGGIYCDLKEMHTPWSPLLERANRDPNVWACGPSEPNRRNSDPATGRLGFEQRIHYERLIFQAAFAFRPGSPWTETWLAEVERRLDYFTTLLWQHPAEQPFGENPDYPVPWYALLAQVLGPLSLKYSQHTLIDPSMSFNYHLGGHR